MDAISGRFVWPLVLDTPVKFHDPSLNCSRNIPPEAVGSGIFDCFPHNFRPQVDNDVISSVAVDSVGMDVHKFSDFWFSRYSRSCFRVD